MSVAFEKEYAETETCPAGKSDEVEDITDSRTLSHHVPY